MDRGHGLTPIHRTRADRTWSTGAASSYRGVAEGGAARGDREALGHLLRRDLELRRPESRRARHPDQRDPGVPRGRRPGRRRRRAGGVLPAGCRHRTLPAAHRRRRRLRAVPARPRHLRLRRGRVLPGNRPGGPTRRALLLRLQPGCLHGAERGGTHPPVRDPATRAPAPREGGLRALPLRHRRGGPGRRARLPREVLLGDAGDLPGRLGHRGIARHPAERDPLPQRREPSLPVPQRRAELHGAGGLPGAGHRRAPRPLRTGDLDPVGGGSGVGTDPVAGVVRRGALRRRWRLPRRPALQPGAAVDGRQRGAARSGAVEPARRRSRLRHRDPRHAARPPARASTGSSGRTTAGSG